MSRSIFSNAVAAIALLVGTAVVQQAAWAVTIGPGANIAGATASDTANQERLNVAKTDGSGNSFVNLGPGVYRIDDFRLNVRNHNTGNSGQGKITPMLVVDAPSPYTTIWVGDAYDPTANGVQTAANYGTFNETFTLFQATDVYAGIFTTDNGSAIPAISLGVGSTDHTNSFTPPTGPGESVGGGNQVRTYAFEINVDVLDFSSMTDLFNTGVDNSGVALGGNVDDPHYQLLIDPSGLGDATIPNPPGSWFGNNGGSRWIGPQDNNTGSEPGGNYTYRTTFNLPEGTVLSTAEILGDWATDNAGLDILINGISTGQTSAGFGSLTSFSITSGFVHGTNTIDFVVSNSAGTNPTNPTGLRVDNIAGFFVAVPEPTSVVLLGLGAVLGLATLRRQRVRVVAAMSLVTFASVCTVQAALVQNNVDANRDASSTDLLQTDFFLAEPGSIGSLEGTGTSLMLLADGIALYSVPGQGTPNYNGNKSLTLGTVNNQSLTYHLDTTANILGYDITGVDFFHGWQDNGRDGMRFTIEYSVVGNASFSNYGSTTKFDPGSNYGVQRVTDDGGLGLIASNVDALRFTPSDIDNGWGGVSEIDVIGTATGGPFPPLPPTPNAMIGPGDDVGTDTSPDNADRLNVEQDFVTLGAGNYSIDDFSFDSLIASGTVVPFLATGSPSSYTTLWVGPSLTATDTGVNSESYAGESITLASTTNVFAGFYTDGGRVDYNGSGVTSHDTVFSAPTVGSTIDGFTAGNLGRTYAFEINVSSFNPIPEPTTFGLAALGVVGLMGTRRRRVR